MSAVAQLLAEASDGSVEVAVPAVHATVDVPSEQLGNPLHDALRVDPFSVVGGTLRADVPHTANVVIRMVHAKGTRVSSGYYQGSRPTTSRSVVPQCAPRALVTRRGRGPQPSPVEEASDGYEQGQSNTRRRVSTASRHLLRSKQGARADVDAQGAPPARRQPAIRARQRPNPRQFHGCT
jgi:hypothetical protein